MRFKNLTPFRCAMRRTSRTPGKVEATLVLRGAFRLAPGTLAALTDDVGLVQGSLRGETFDADDDARAGQARYPGDFADWKLNAEVMFVGSAHAPKGVAAKEFPVKLALGTWSKTLAFTGPRAWTRSVMGDVVSDPLAVTSHPLDWSIAFGGPTVPENPVGCGPSTGRAPMLEYAGARVSSGRALGKPAGFGPISSNWAARVARRGTRYDAEWEETRAPFYPSDFDGRYFHAAPDDQQLRGFLTGDERLQLVNLHPTHAMLECALPSLRPRAFVKGDALREVPLSLDTVFVDGDASVVFLTWRGHTPAADPELRDLVLGLVATEPLAEAPLPMAHYAALFAAFEADPIGLDAVRKVAKDALDEAAADLPDGPAPSDSDVIRMPDLSGLSAISPKLADKMRAQGARASSAVPKEGDAKKRVEEAVAGPQASPVEARKKRAAALRGARGEIEKARGAATKAKAPPEQLAALDAMLKDERLAAAEKLADTLEVPTEAELVPGAKLADRDLSDMDLTGRDLSGADLSGADLSRCNLDGARLVGAKLARARLVNASLEGADLSGATLDQSVWVEVRAIDAKLDAAGLSRAILTEVDLTGASLRKVKATLLVLSRVKLARAALDEAELERALFDATDLEEASFKKARLDGCPLHGCKAQKASFADARLDGSSFNEADLGGADFRRARGARCSFFKADLTRADLRRAVLTDTHFSEARFTEVRAFAADLRLARFRLTDMARADLRHANLFCADLGRARVTSTNFADANLYGAQLLGLAGDGAHFVGANLATARMERA